MINEEKFNQLNTIIKQYNATLVAVSKLKPLSDIEKLYNLGQRDFGENYVLELVDKQIQLPKDINWHFIGHLQSNKVKYIAPFVHLIQSVDSEKLLVEIDKQAAKNNRIIKVLLQVHIAEETTKFGFNENELLQLPSLKNIKIEGLMGMSTFTADKEKVKREFEHLKNIYENLSVQKDFSFSILSIGMSDDYEIALHCKSNMIRIGSLLFGARK